MSRLKSRACDTTSPFPSDRGSLARDDETSAMAQRTDRTAKANTRGIVKLGMMKTLKTEVVCAER